MSERPRIVVVGASAGGVDALMALVGALPADLQAAVFIVLHVAPMAKSVLPSILERRAQLPVAAAESEAPVVVGTIAVAPPDCHLLLHRGVVHVTRGPRENGHRPSVDVLFRSAALHYGADVVGVVLSGALDDGAAGLRAIRDAGGVAVVQDPADAVYPSMPEAAIAATRTPHVAPAAELGELVAELVRRPPKGHGLTLVQEQQVEMEVEPAEMTVETTAKAPGAKTDLVCPECNGALREVVDGELVRYRCRVGHAYSAEAYAAEHARALEAALWTGVRALEERAEFCRRLAARFAARAQLPASRYEREAEEALQHGAVLRQVLESLRSPETHDLTG